MFENYKKTPKRQSNPRLGLLRSSFLLLIIRITAKFAHALRSKSITWRIFELLEKMLESFKDLDFRVSGN